MAEQKIIPQHIKAVNGREVTGVFAVFGNLDSYDDRIWPGAFLETFAQDAKRMYHLWQHDTSQPPIAVIKSLREVTRDQLPAEVLAYAPEAMGGAEVTREYLKTPRGDEVLAAIEAGSPLRMSFMYDALRYDFERKPDAKYSWEEIRNLRQLKTYETSDVLFGANEATTASKSLEHTPKQLLRQLYAQLKAGQRHSSADIALLNEVHRMLVELGATTCAGILDPDATDDEPKTAPGDPAIWTAQAKNRLRLAAALLPR